MRKSSISVDQDQFHCPVCLDLLKDPVTIPCGHSYCKACINGVWREVKGIYSCPECRATFTPRPVLHRAIMLTEVVEKLKKNQLQAASPAHCYAGPEDVACDSCLGRKHKAVKWCLVCQVSFCEDHLQPHYQSPAFKKHELVEACKDLQENICTEHDKLMELYCRTDRSFICYLCTIHKPREEEEERNTGQISAPNVGLVSQVAVSDNDRNDVELLNCMEETTSKICPPAAAVLMISPTEPKSREDFLQYFCPLTLDPSTAHPELILSEKNRVVTRTIAEQSYSEHPDRFDCWPQVLCKESVCGRCYWEVEWSGNVDVAVSYKDLSRKGQGDECLFGYNSQSWSLDCFSSSVCFWHDSTETELREPEFSRIGVYVDPGAGTLSFYSVSDTMRLLHRVRTAFTLPLYAGFGLHYESFLRLL